MKEFYLYLIVKNLIVLKINKNKNFITLELYPLPVDLVIFDDVAFF